MQKTVNPKLKFVMDIVVILLGSAIFSAGVHAFTAPANIAPGGVTGLSTIIHYLTGFPIGLAVSLFNVPLLLICFRFLGKRFFFRTMLSTLAISLFIDVIFARVPTYKGDPIMAAVFGGVLIGLGMALVFTREGTTGGTDIVNKLLQRKFPHVPLGTLTFSTDIVIILAACLVYGNIESGLYAIISMFVASKVIDSMMYGMSEGKMILIVSDSSEEIAERIMKMHRGVTMLDATGAYSKMEKKVILCAVAKPEYYRVKRIVKEIDPSAFMIITNAGEVLGEGFQQLDVK